MECQSEWTNKRTQETFMDGILTKKLFLDMSVSVVVRPRVRRYFVLHHAVGYRMMVDKPGETSEQYSSNQTLKERSKSMKLTQTLYSPDPTPPSH